MPHFFINSKNITENLAIINDKDNYQHIARSLRAKVGEKILLIDENRIEYECKITKINKNEIETEILNKYPSKNDLAFNLYLAQSPLRSEAQSFVIEKATELGVRGVYPIMTDNCSLNKSVIKKKIPKWQKIMQEASKQCERASVPNCFDLTTLENLINSKKFNRIIAFCERNYKKNLKDIIKTSPLQTDENILVIIGPEGGFSAKEFKIFEESGIMMLTLGDLILKAETAVIVGLGNIIYEFTNNK